MFPSLNQKEWLQLVMGDREPRIVSHLLKIRVTTLRQKVKRKMISPEDAVKELYDDCKQHEEIYKKDLHQIFKKQKNQSF